MNDPSPTPIDWRPLYRAGGIAPFVAILFFVIERTVILAGEPYPRDMATWFALFERSPLLGMIYVNALDILSIALLAVMLLAACVALRERQQAVMAMALLIAAIGAAVTIAPRAGTLGILELSEQYAATDDADARQRLLAAGEALGVQARPTPQMPGFLFLAVAGLLVSLTMVDGRVFSATCGYSGIAGNVLVLADHVSLVLYPAAADVLMGLSGIPLVLWWVLSGARLLQLSRRSALD